VMNYANPDMVGHTGAWEAILTALEVVDDCLGRVEKAALDAGAILMVTADHGNAEAKIDVKTGKPLTAHTANPVPFVLVGDGSGPLRSGGRLCDVAPTICQLMNLKAPPEMTGTSLLS
jgi:2,3-bisphosphoglycerate-independent phosphoglycerate mutase